MVEIVIQKIAPVAAPVVTSDDLWAEFGQLKIADSTRKQYVKAIENFCQFAYNCPANPETTSQFLALDPIPALELVLRYRRHLLEKLAPSTINVRLAAIKSLTDMARRLGKTTIDLGDVRSIPAETYRDTRGISVEQFIPILDRVDRTTPIGVRDYAILRLFWDHALRRGEIASANIGDFVPQERKLWILGKGKRTRVAIDLTEGVTLALAEWLKLHPCSESEQPLIVSLSHNHYGARIAGDSIYRIVQGYAQAAGIERRVSPHRIRHSSITAFLDASGGNLRAAQALSRHSNQNTLTLYDDNRRQEQKGASGMLEDLLTGTGGK